MLTVNNVPFQLTAADNSNVVSGVTTPIPLPRGKYSSAVLSLRSRFRVILRLENASHSAECRYPVYDGMDTLKSAWRHFFDIRPGEYRRTIFMALYLLFVLCAYYVLKSASEAMFLNKFDI